MRQGSILTYLHADHRAKGRGRIRPLRLQRPLLRRRRRRRFALGRFIQADTIVPSPANPQSLNRYAYTLNNPLRYTDPTGHEYDERLPGGGGGGFGGGLWSSDWEWKQYIKTEYGTYEEYYGQLFESISGYGTDVTQVGEIDSVGQNDLPDDEVLYQYSRKPGPNGEYKGFPDTLRSGEGGMSCQVGSECCYDPSLGFKQQFDGQEPGSGDWVRETTVADVKQWEGRVDPDGWVGNPWENPPGHATIYSEGGEWGKPFKRIWQNAHSLLTEE